MTIDNLNGPTADDLKHMTDIDTDDIDWAAIAREIADDPWEGFTGGYSDDDIEDDSYNDGFDYYESEALTEDWDTSHFMRKRP